MAFIYALVDSRSPSEYRYIGKTVKTLAHRLYCHKYKSNRDLNLHKVRWMNKVESEGGEVLAVLLEECSDADQDAREIHWIREMRASGHSLTNMSDGGEGGINPCTEVIAKISAALMGKKRPPHVVEILRKVAKERTGAKNGMFGRTHTAEANAKIVAGRIGVPLTADHKAKLAENSSRTKLTAEQATEIYRLSVVEKLSHKLIVEQFPIVSTKAVSHIATGMRWKHLNLAERFA